jgi:hypothetical protein
MTNAMHDASATSERTTKATAIQRGGVGDRLGSISPSGGETFGDSIDTAIEVLSKLIDPEAHHMPSKACQLMIAPEIVLASIAISVTVMGFAIDFDIDPLLTLDQSQIEKTAGNRILWDRLQSSRAQRVVNFFSQGD